MQSFLPAGSPTCLAPAYMPTSQNCDIQAIWFVSDAGHRATREDEMILEQGRQTERGSSARWTGSLDRVAPEKVPSPTESSPGTNTQRSTGPAASWSHLGLMEGVVVAGLVSRYHQGSSCRGRTQEAVLRNPPLRAIVAEGSVEVQV